jgi:hypothetical protein
MATAAALAAAVQQQKMVLFDISVVIGVDELQVGHTPPHQQQQN